MSGKRPSGEDDPYKLTRGQHGDWLTDYFAKMAPAALAWFDVQAGESEPGPPSGGFMIPPELRSEILATKLSATLLVSDELLHPRPPRPLTRRQRLTHRTDMWRNLAARRAYKIIAGYWPDAGEDNW